MINPSAINPLTLPSVLLSERSRLPAIPCIYFVIDSFDVVQYIGKSINPKQRWTGHQRYPLLTKMDGVKISYMPVDINLLSSVEKALIAWFSPPLNLLRPSVHKSNSTRLKIVFEVEVEGLGQVLRQAREKAKLSVASAGERAGMSGANFSRIENEETKGVPIETLIKAAKAVGLDLSSYLGEWVKSMPGITIKESDNNV
ncbi:helix-turn-helix domain-containing protein [Nostoc sp. DedQUE07]|uniref:helix-turn-helix domain-containing protein n=1 Tax=Nostoc sp. DedQUE07 TaxID=3075392 RepID=UPI002AD4CB89|nr:helix-turn-helix domain-containing protein [Nostoc sp. DedQUE07]MDZ8131973.1 helix-turn-helix domain-containing protein [Nostoc sp. DedQUE07]